MIKQAFAVQNEKSDVMEFAYEVKHVVLEDKREAYLNDEDALSLTMVCNKERILTYPIDYPQAGYGGGSLYLSPDNRYLLFFYYSGQSEEAFTLFEIGDSLKAVYCCDYRQGEAASYCFSGDGKLLVQGLPYTCSEWWQLAEDSEVNERGMPYFDFGHINVLQIETRTLSEHLIRVYPPDDWQPQVESYSPFMLPKLSQDSLLKISMPWGEETIPLPMEDIIDIALR